MGQDHSLPAEIKRAAEAAVKQGIMNIQPGETMEIDLSQESVYVHLGHGVNVIKMVVQRPGPEPE